jgi:hypothetical protein
MDRVRVYKTKVSPGARWNEICRSVQSARAERRKMGGLLRKRFLLLGLPMMLPTPCHAVASWQPIDANDPGLSGADLFLDRNSVIKTGALRQFRVLLSYGRAPGSQPLAASGGKSLVENVEVDCEKNTMKLVSLSVYADAWGKQIIEGSEKKGSQFSLVSPDSVDHLLLDYACTQWR